MLFDCDKNILRLTEQEEELKPRHVIQLSAWGFKKIVAGRYEASLSPEEPSLIKKVEDYLRKQNLVYALSPACRSFIDAIEERSAELTKIFRKAEQFKDGQYDEQEFSDFGKFLQSHTVRRLKGHQVKAAYHLYLLGNGANFSVPGSGKTAVLLSVFEKLRLEGKVNVLFVVGPASSFGPWRDEFEQVLGRRPKYIILAGGNKTARRTEYYNFEDYGELYLTTFQTLLHDQQDVSSFLGSQNINALIVIDEAHYIKRLDGNWANAVLRISRHSKYRSVLTGTPIPNSYVDLFNIFSFLWPHHTLLDQTKKSRLRYCEDHRDYSTAKKILEPVIGPLFYRVRKKELNLKKQIFLPTVLVKPNPIEKKVYEAIVRKIRGYAKDDYLKNIDLINGLRKGRMMRLRQCLSFTGLLDDAIGEYDEDLLESDNDLRYDIHNYSKLETPAKLKKLMSLIQKFQRRKEKVVIWTNFIGTIELIMKSCRENGYYSKKIIGDTPIERATVSEEETREQIRNEFVNDLSGLDVLVANPAACAESISLHKTCHNAIYYDLSYNCAQYLQSLDRIHRVGGSEKQEAYYYFLQYQETIEQDILASVQGKARKMSAIIDEDYCIYSMDMGDDTDELEAYQRLFTS